MAGRSVGISLPLMTFCLDRSSFSMTNKGYKRLCYLIINLSSISSTRINILKDAKERYWQILSSLVCSSHY